jgi:hypothetical protein
MHDAEKFFEGKWDDTMPVERKSVAAASPTNPSPETSDEGKRSSPHSYRMDPSRGD